MVKRWAGFFENRGNRIGLLFLALFALWIVTIPFLPKGGARYRGAETPLGFVGKLWRLSASASNLVDTEKIEIDRDLTAVKVKVTGQSFSADDLMDRTEDSTIVVLCHPEDLLVCQYGPYIFVVDNRDLIIHLATLESWEADGLYPCPQHSVAKPDAASKKPERKGNAGAVLTLAKTPSGANRGTKPTNEPPESSK